MESSYLGIVFSSIWIVNCFCSTDFRNISEINKPPHGQLQNSEKLQIFWVYPDNPNLPGNQGYYTNLRPSDTLAGVESSIRVAEPMKLEAQQTLFDYQRRPIEASSNHGKSLLQPIIASPHFIQDRRKKSYNNSPKIVSSQTIVNPIQTSNVIQRNVQHPLYNIQPQYYIPKKYGLVNGKLVYDPTSLQLVQRHSFPTVYHSSQQFPQFQHALAHQHQRKLVAQPVVFNRLPPITRSHFEAPPSSQFQPIDTPSEPPVQRGQEQQENPNEEEKPVSEENEEEEDGDNASYEDENDDDEPEHYETPEIEKYIHDDEDDHEDIENIDDEDDDSDRVSTSFAPSRKFPKKYNYKPDKKGVIIYGRKYEQPLKSSLQKPKKKQKMHYKSYRYSKDSSQYPEVIEGRQSENVPVRHKQNILREKWYLTKSSDDERFE